MDYNQNNDLITTKKSNKAKTEFNNRFIIHLDCSQNNDLITKKSNKVSQDKNIFENRLSLVLHAVCWHERK